MDVFMSSATDLSLPWPAPILPSPLSLAQVSGCLGLSLPHSAPQAFLHLVLN